MWSFTLIVAAFVVALIAFAFAFGTPILGVPIAIIGITAIALVDFSRRRKQAKQMHEFRDEAKAEKIEFTDRDQETLVSE
jgi:membrane protein implicated in regulation of membrane protease activity